MNISTGIYRLAQVFKWSGRVVGAIWLLGLFYNYIGRSNSPPLNADAYFFLGSLVVFVALTEGIAWILEGFADD